MVRAVLILCLTMWWGSIPSVTAAQTLGALARVIPEGSTLSGAGGAVDVQLQISQPVPFRVFALEDPARVVVDFRAVDFATLPEGFDQSSAVTLLETGGATTPGWTRMVMTLEAPMLPTIAAMQTDRATGTATVTLRLEATDAARFAEAAGAPAGVDAVVLPVMTEAPEPSAANDRLIIMLDPGHGGVDPGALREGYSEADLILGFARELRDVMRRTGLIDVVMTREADIFVPLPTRVTLARAAEADLLISLHADAIAEGRAQGATVYTLADEASDLAAAALAEQHDRADLLQGVDLTGTDDEVVGILLDLVRAENAPRSRAFADTLVAAIDAAELELHARPRGEGAFSVLKAADFASVLLEIGFLSEGGDLENILDPDWRAQMQDAITAAVLLWAEEDTATAALRRQ